jgi:hypothetical protein
MGWPTPRCLSVAQDATSFSRQVIAYLHCAGETKAGIANVTTQIDSVGEATLPIPVSVNSRIKGNAWVCSPHTTYVDYAAEEARRLVPALLARPAALLCMGIGAALRPARIDDAVMVNNWLLSTNIYPDLDGATYRRWLEEATGRWPDHAVWFRSLNRRHNADLIDELTAIGCLLVPSRQVYLFDSVDPSGRAHANLQRDMRLLDSWQHASSSSCEWTEEDFSRAQTLYEALYIEKYSKFNPRYTAGFLKAWSRSGLLSLRGFRDEQGVLQAVLGTFESAGTLTAPIVGYNTDLPQRLGLYRILMASALRSAAETRQRVNLSAGAAEFKRLRGGTAEIEYSAVFVRHLPRCRRLAIKLLASITSSIGEPMMKRYKL